MFDIISVYYHVPYFELNKYRCMVMNEVNINKNIIMIIVLALLCFFMSLMLEWFLLLIQGVQ